MRNILVLNNEELLGAAISSLLQAEEGLELYGFTPSSTADLVAALCESNHPDVLILDSIAAQTQDVRQFLSQLSSQLGTCVIVIDIANNRINVNNIYDISIRQPKDLIEIVRYDLPRFSTHYLLETITGTTPTKNSCVARVAENPHAKQPRHRRPDVSVRNCNH